MARRTRYRLLATSVIVVITGSTAYESASWIVESSFDEGQPASSAQMTVRLAYLSFACTPGEIFGVVEPDSAGKTTTKRLFGDIMSPDAPSLKVQLLKARPSL